MKTLKVITLIVAIFALNLNTANANPIKPTDELRSEIIDIIGANYWDNMNQDESSVEVLFTVNSKRELIVLSVNSKNEEAISYFKKELNYKKVNYKPTKHGEVYLLPVKMIKA